MLNISCVSDLKDVLKGIDKSHCYFCDIIVKNQDILRGITNIKIGKETAKIIDK